jgi:phosphoesterase RecJ-like protein
MYDEVIALISDATRILVVQAENPDGDSLGSALALEELLGDMGKEVRMYCPGRHPKVPSLLHWLG